MDADGKGGEENGEENGEESRKEKGDLIVQVAFLIIGKRAVQRAHHLHYSTTASCCDVIAAPAICARRAASLTASLAAVTASLAATCARRAAPCAARAADAA